MSSHHFVREGQEPDIIVAGCDIDTEILGTLLEWSPRVIAIDDAAEKLLLEQIKVDVHWISDLRFGLAFPYPVETKFQEDIKVVEQIKEFLSAHGKPVYLFGWPEEDVYALFKALGKETATFITVIGHDKKWLFPGGAGYSKWWPKGSRLFLTGEREEWHISPEVDMIWPEIKVPENGIFSLQTNDFEIIGEALYL
jgi:thiamine pyrophosphokinase